jgi:hypothetical protein
METGSAPEVESMDRPLLPRALPSAGPDPNARPRPNAGPHPNAHPDVPPRRPPRTARGCRRIAALCALGLLASCSFVSIDAQGERVELREASAIGSGCTKIATVSARTFRGFPLFRRSQETLARELGIEARNEAGTLGADTVSATSPVTDGRQTFDAYRCSRT